MAATCAERRELPAVAASTRAADLDSVSNLLPLGVVHTYPMKSVLGRQMFAIMVIW